MEITNIVIELYPWKLSLLEFFVVEKVLFGNKVKAEKQKRVFCIFCKVKLSNVAEWSSV